MCGAPAEELRGDVVTVAGTRTGPSVYTTTAFSRHERIGGGYARGPAGLVHAKTWGSATTLCGVGSMTWPKFFDISFFRVEENRCPVCTTAAATVSLRDAVRTD